MCDLPIVGFNLFEDDYCFLLDEVIEAISKKHPELVISKDAINRLIETASIEKGLFLTSEGVGSMISGVCSDKSRYVTKITKKDVIRLYSLIFDGFPVSKHEEPKVKQLTKSERRLKTMSHINKQYPNLQTKREVFEKCKEINRGDFSIEFESFSTGSTAIWNTAKEAGINWKSIG